MSTAPTGGTSTAAYTTLALLSPWVPSNFQTAQASGAGTSNVKGQVSADDIAALIQKHCRIIDGRLWTAGVQTPFLDIAASGSPTPPRPPAQVQEAATFLVASDIRKIMKFGQARGGQSSTTPAKQLKEDAESILQAIEKNPSVLPNVSVSTPEDFTIQAVSGSIEAGKMGGPYYRLKNRNVLRHTIRFVNSSNVELMRPGGILPFQERADYTVISAAEGTLVILNSHILAQVASGSGGVVYDWTYLRLDRFIPRSPRFPGVAR